VKQIQILSQDPDPLNVDLDPAIGSGSGQFFGIILNDPDSQVESGSSPMIRILPLDPDPIENPDPAFRSGHSGQKIRILLLDPDPLDDSDPATGSLRDPELWKLDPSGGDPDFSLVSLS